MKRSTLERSYSPVPIARRNSSWRTTWESMRGSLWRKAIHLFQLREEIRPEGRPERAWEQEKSIFPPTLVWWVFLVPCGAASPSESGSFEDPALGLLSVFTVKTLSSLSILYTFHFASSVRFGSRAFELHKTTEKIALLQRPVWRLLCSQKKICHRKDTNILITFWDNGPFKHESLGQEHYVLVW